jgi:undecaprenyl-diphosphatase
VNPVLAAAILGAIQGVTEFLPISSSGHLKLLEGFLPPTGDATAFDLALHLGTLVPVLVTFREDLARMVTDPLRAVSEDAAGGVAGGGTPRPMRWTEAWTRPGVRWLAWVVVASVPTALIGLALEDVFETHLSGFGALSWQFAVTALALHHSGRVTPGARDVTDMTWKDALTIGTAQGIAVLPAVSRSGATIVCALMLGLRREVAGSFSFVLSVPAILGACALKARKLDLTHVDVAAWGTGAAVALVVGWVALRFLLRVVRGGRFQAFAWYCWGMAALCGALALR